MKNTILEDIRIIGISVRTDNGHDNASNDIVALWNRFMGEGILHHIPGRLSDYVYSVYTDYESDHTGGYTTVLGCAVHMDTDVPAGMTTTLIPGGKYLKSEHRGDLTQGAVVQEWMKIWSQDKELDRNYKADFEIYNDEIGDPTNSKFEIFIGVN